MKRQPAVAVSLLVLGLAGCSERAPTAPDIRATAATPLLQRSPNAGLTLRPSGFGPHTYAAWKAKEGLPDETGNGDHALFFQKPVPTATPAAGIAVIQGFEEGTLFTEITGLGWDHRVDGHCGAGAPRWTVAVSEGERQGFVHIGCSAAAHGPPIADERGRLWIRDTYTNASIALGIATGAISLTNPAINLGAATIDALYIIFDEGVDAPPPPPHIYLDNITVEVNGIPTVFTGPADNGTSR